MCKSHTCHTCPNFLCVNLTLSHTCSTLAKFHKCEQSVSKFTQHKSRESVRSLPVLLTLSPTTSLHTKTEVCLKSTQQLARHERTTQQSTKAMETMRAVTTRTANARVKARSGVCKCVDCCCCCFCSSWDSRGQDVLSGHHPRRIAVVVRRLTINNIIGPERAEKQAAWQRVKSKAMTEKARIIIVS